MGWLFLGLGAGFIVGFLFCVDRQVREENREAAEKKKAYDAKPDFEKLALAYEDAAENKIKRASRWQIGNPGEELTDAAELLEKAKELREEGLRSMMEGKI